MRKLKGIRLRAALGLLLMTQAGAACQALNAPVYFAAPDTLVVGGMDENGVARAESALGSVVLRFRRPTEKEREKLQMDSDRLGFDVPWLQRDRLHIEVLYTIKNLDTEPGEFRVRVNGATEYTKYDEAAIAAIFEAAGEDPVFLPLMLGGPRILAPGEIYQGVVREDDFSEASLDLDAMGRWMAPFASVLINRSEVNPIGMEMVPPALVVPALFEVDLTLNANKHMTCDFVVRVRDDDDRLYHRAGDSLFVPKPALFMPVLAPAM